MMLSSLFVLLSFGLYVLAADPLISFPFLRIEGATSTIYEGIIAAFPKNVTTASGGTHPCTGTNDGANPTPAGTCTTALDNAAELDGFTWDGTFDTEYDDFFITRISTSSQTSTQFWGLLLNYQYTPVGGCQAEVTNSDHILWAYNAFNAMYFLKLTGPEVALVGEAVEVSVTDGMTGAPLAGASVGGATTGEDGKATLTFEHPGVQKLKAERDNSIRSNALVIGVV